MDDKKLILLCNSPIAIPALKELLFFQRVAVIIIPQKNNLLAQNIEELLVEYNTVSLLKVTKENFAQLLEDQIKSTAPEAVVMMTFPYKIPASLLPLPKKGFINFHYGALPQYRGAEPIFAQLVHQEKTITLAVHIVTEGIDTGPIIVQKSIPIGFATTYGKAQQLLADAGAKLIGTLYKILQFGSFIPSIPQDESIAGYHKKPTAQDLMIDFEKMDSNTIIALINACNPWNKGAGVTLQNKNFQIVAAEIIESENQPVQKAGTILTNSKSDGLQIIALDHKVIKATILYNEDGFLTPPLEGL